MLKVTCVSHKENLRDKENKEKKEEKEEKLLMSHKKIQHKLNNKIQIKILEDKDGQLKKD